MVGAEIAKSALILVGTQNDFVHPEGSFVHLARETPETKADPILPLLHSLSQSPG